VQHFPHGDNDDLVDSMTQAVMRFRQGGLIQHPEDYKDEKQEAQKNGILLMAVSAFQKLVNKLFKQFALRHGREPQTPAEWMSIQNEAVQYFNKTKGVPGAPTEYDDITKKMWKDRKPPFQGFKPKVIQGGKGIEGIAAIEQKAKKIEELNKKLKKMQDEKTAMYPGSKDKRFI
jgi:hypothetical protein